MQVEAFLEQSARLYPGKVALVCGDRRLTYAELDVSANRLARGLRAAGPGRSSGGAECTIGSAAHQWD